MLQAILIGLIVFIGKADYFIGTAMFGRPLVLGALVGIVLGDIPTGVMIGFQLELIFMGMQAIGASIPPDMIVGSVLGTAFAITTGKGMETAITIAMPAAILSAFVVNLFYGVITPIMAKAADRFAEEGKYKKIEGVFLSNGFLFDLTFAVIAFGAFLFGGDSVTAVVNAIPGWLTTGIGIAAGILPALGFAQLINMIMNEDTWYVVRNTRGVTGFVGPGSKPVPLTEAEMRPLGIEVEDRENAEVNIVVDFQEGDTIQVTSGAWEGTVGVIQSMNYSKQIVTINVDMFGRETPVKIGFAEVKKL